MTAVRARVDGLQRGAHAGAAGADDDDVVLVGLHRVDAFLFRGASAMRVQNDGSRSAGEPDGHGSNVKITSVPSTTTTRTRGRAAS